MQLARWLVGRWVS